MFHLYNTTVLLVLLWKGLEEMPSAQGSLMTLAADKFAIYDSRLYGVWKRQHLKLQHSGPETKYIHVGLYVGVFSLALSSAEGQR